MPNPNIRVRMFHDVKVSAVTASERGVHFRFEKDDQMGVNLGTIPFMISENSPINFSLHSLVSVKQIFSQLVYQICCRLIFYANYRDKSMHVG